MDILQLFSWSGLVNGIFSLGFGIFIASRDWKSRANQLLLAFTLAISFWSFSYWRWLMFTTDAEGALFWARMLDFGSLWIPITFFHWLDSTFGFSKQHKYIKYVIVLGYVVTLTFSLFAFSNLYVNRVEPELFFPFWPKAGILYHFFIFGLYAWLLILYPLLLLFKRHKRTLAESKGMLYVSLGVIFGSLGGATNFLLWYDIPIAPYGNFLVPIWVFFLGYATVRYHAFGPKVITTEFLVFLIWSFLLSRIFFAANFMWCVIDVLIFLFVLVIGILLISSVRREVRQKEQLNEANIKLQDLNQNLEQKVAAQTQEVRRAYEVEKKARVELEELDKAKDQFILTTQHHLRTPLTIVKGYVDSLLNKPPKTTLAESKDALNKTSVATGRLASLVNELLDISQMQVGKDILRREPVNPKKIVEEVLSELQPEIEKRRIETTINIPEDSTIEADPHKIKDALTNLLDNAVKYNKEGGEIKIKGEKTRHPIERDKQIYRITIEDTGIGISPEELPKLFTQYFQRGKEAEKLYTTGRGIGLAVTRNIIAAHNGRIYAESEGRGKGARFVVELPAD